MRYTQSLRFKLTALLIAAILFPLLVSNLLNLKNSIDFIESSVYEQNERLVHQMTAQLDLITGNLDETLSTMAQLENLQSMNPDLMDDVLQSAVKNASMISQMYVMNTKGMQVYKTSGQLGDRSDRDYFQRAVQGERYYSDVIISGSTGLPIVVLAEPIRRNGRVVGVLGASIDLEKLSLLASAVKTGKTGYGFIVEDNGRLIAHPDQSLVEAMTDVSDLPPVSASIQGNSGVTEYLYDGDSKLAAYMHIPQTRWGVVVQTPADEAFAQVTSQRNSLLLMLGIFTLVSSVLAYGLSKSITGPIMLLTEQTEALASGDLTAKMPEKLRARTDEFGALARSFMTMQDTTRGIIDDIQRIAKDSRSSSNVILSLSEQMGHTSEDIAQTIHSVAEGATDQAQETTRSAEITGTLADLVDHINDKLKSAVALSESMSVQNDAGQNAVEAFASLYRKNAELTQESVQLVYELSEKSTFIGSIIETIQNITEQTSLLALNASIEAARAGEHGRGFAVVADEVRKLAGQSSSATIEIRDRMADISGLIQRTDQAMRASQEINDTTSSSLAETREILKSVGTASSEVSSRVSGLTADIEKIESSKDHVVEAIGNVSVVAQESAAATEEVSASVEEMTASIEEIVSAMQELGSLIDALAQSTESFRL